MCGNGGLSYRQLVARVLMAFALAAPPACAAFAQAIDIAPLLTPPVPKVVPTPTPEVLRPLAPPTATPEAIPPGPPVRIDDAPDRQPV